MSGSSGAKDVVNLGLREADHDILRDVPSISVTSSGTISCLDCMSGSTDMRRQGPLDRASTTSMFECARTDGPSLVLAAVDSSSSAHHAAIYAAGLARRNSARLVYVHVRRPVPVGLWFDAVGGPLEVGPEDYDASWLLDELAKMSEQAYGVRAEKIVAEGIPAREIARIADERRVDAVVVGRTHRLSHRIAGSTAQWLVSHGNWPVMVVP